MKHKYQKFNSLQGIINTYGIDVELANRLSILESLKVVLLIDDSTVMNEKLSNHRTRWEQLRLMVYIIFNIVIVNQPLDIYFLNRTEIKAVNNYDEINRIFNTPPWGTNNITNILTNLIKNYEHQNVLIIVAINEPPINTNEYIQILQDRDSERCRITFLSTSDETDISYLNQKQMKNVSYHNNYLLQHMKEDEYYSLADNICDSLLGTLPCEKEVKTIKKMKCFIL